VNHRFAILALTLAVPVFAQAPKPDATKIVLTIGDTKLTAADFEELINVLPPQYQAQARSGAGKRAFAEQYIQLLVLAEAAEKDKLDQQDNIKKQIAFARLSVVAGAEFTNIQENVRIDDAAIEKYYNDHKSEYEVVKARHILIHVKGAPGPPPKAGKTELTDAEALEKAKAIRARLVGGEDFALVASAESDDSSASNGGSLGEFGKGMMVPPFEQAAFALKVGDLSEPVKSPFGYHIIKVESHGTKPLAEVKASIQSKLRPQLAREALDNLRKGAKVEIDDSYFGPAPPPAPPTAQR
jgi:peptidyl-prolyl cis-trans isomerase C